MNRGYTFLWRKQWDNEFLFPRGHVFSRSEAWNYLVNHEARGTDDPKSGLKRGQFCVSVKDLAIRWKWSKAATARFIDGLVNRGMISQVMQLVKQSPMQCLRQFTICNYEICNPARTVPDAVPDAVTDVLPLALSPTPPLLYPPPVIKEGKKGSPSDCATRPTDDRRKPLIEFLFADYKERTGLSLAVPFKSGVKALTDMLQATKDDPSYCLERLKSAWVTLMETDDPFVQKQNPVRYFAQNLNALLSQPKLSNTRQSDLPLRTQRNLSAAQRWLSKHEELDARKGQD